MTGLSRAGALRVATLALLLSACTRGTAEPTTPPTSEPVTAPASTTTTSTTRPISTTSSAAITTTTAPPSEVLRFVVAEEEAGRLAVIGRTEEDEPACGDGISPCGQFGVVSKADVPPGPHNLVASDGVVFATHPRLGVLSRLELATGEVESAEVGLEPHDVKASPEGDPLYVTDERGGSLLLVDPDSLEVLEEVELPGEPHDLAFLGRDAWITLVGRDELARLRDGQMELVPTGRAPHDLQADPEGRIWFSNWGSPELDVLDPQTGEVSPAPAGVVEPHHFGLDPSGIVWVSDNGGSSVVGFLPQGPVVVEVGPVPHHLAWLDGILAVAVSGAGQAVLIEEEVVVGRVELSAGLHGVAAVRLSEPRPEGP